MKSENTTVNADFVELFQRIRDRVQYQHTRFLSNFIYDLDFTKYKQPRAGEPHNLLEQLVNITKSDYKASDILTFASFLGTARISEIEVIHPGKTTVALHFTGELNRYEQEDPNNSTPGVSRHYWAFKGTVPTLFHRYLVAYTKLALISGSQIKHVISRMSELPMADHVVCGHSYGGWLAATAVERMQRLMGGRFRKRPVAYMYNAPMTGQMRKQPGVVYQSDYLVTKQRGNVSVIHPDDPISNLAPSKILTAGAHSSTAIRFDGTTLSEETLEALPEAFVPADYGLNEFPHFKALLHQLEIDVIPGRSSAMLGKIKESLGQPGQLFEDRAFMNYLTDNGYSVKDLKQEAQIITWLFNRLKVTVVKESTPLLVGANAVAAVGNAITHSSAWNAVRNWCTKQKTLSNDQSFPGQYY